MRKIAIITGGTSGVGLKLVQELLGQNYRVYSISTNKEKIRSLEQDYPAANFISTDISDYRELEAVASQIAEKEGKVDLLVNNAGITGGSDVEGTSHQEWERVFAVNVGGVFNCVKAFLPLIKKAEDASIINISSISSQITGSSMAYSASKAALDMMTKSMARDLAKYKIRVNGVNPGLMKTGFQVHNQMMTDEDYKQMLNSTAKDYPLGIGEAEDLIGLIIFLISSEARWITGSNYVIDGGKLCN